MCLAIINMNDDISAYVIRLMSDHNPISHLSFGYTQQNLWPTMTNNEASHVDILSRKYGFTQSYLA